MAYSNQQLIIKLRGITENLPKIVEQAGSMLVRNVRSQARARLGNNTKYPYELRNSFQHDEVVYFKASESAVIVNHPAANRLEYGTTETLTIKPIHGEFLKFEGRDGEDVYTREVKINPTRPVGYAKAAIKETQIDLAKKFKEVVNG